MNGRIASESYSPRQFDRTLRWSNGGESSFKSVELCYSDTATPAQILKSASDPDGIKFVSEQALSMFIQGVGGAGKTDDLLYIIREKDYSRACKVGYTCKPIERLVGLQCGTWRELKLEAVFCPVKANIQKLERAILAAADRRGLRISGEWISATPIEATALIMEFARRNGWSLCGGDVWADNLGARVAGLRAAQQLRRDEFDKTA